MLRYAFLCVTLICLCLGANLFWQTTKYLLAYLENPKSVFQEIDCSQIKIIDQETISYSASNRSVVSICLINNKKIAISDMPENADRVLILRTSEIDPVIKQEFLESIEAYKYINSIFSHFFSEYLVSIFVIIFGLLLLLPVFLLSSSLPKVKSQEKLR